MLMTPNSQHTHGSRWKQGMWLKEQRILLTTANGAQSYIAGNMECVYVDAV